MGHREQWLPAPPYSRPLFAAALGARMAGAAPWPIRQRIPAGFRASGIRFSGHPCLFWGPSLIYLTHSLESSGPLLHMLTLLGSGTAGIAVMTGAFYGWGRLTRRLAGLPVGTWPLSVALGLAAAVFLGDILNLAEWPIRRPWQSSQWPGWRWPPLRCARRTCNGGLEMRADNASQQQERACFPSGPVTAARQNTMMAIVLLGMSAQLLNFVNR